MDPQTEHIRQTIDAFISERLQAKLDDLKEDDQDKRHALQLDYSRENWLRKAAKDAAQLQMATHLLKYSHPKAKGTSIDFNSNRQLPLPLVGSAGNSHQRDFAVGNAAALYLVKLLERKVSGQELFVYAAKRDASFKAALSENPEDADAICDAFAAITQGSDKPSSHTLAKQLYFPLPDGGYHLLSPLYSTALAHRLHQHIQHDRFSEAAKVARAARRKNIAHPHGHREHPNLGMRKFGGSKPQNISQLNSERGGVGYLLSSLPPTWTYQGIKPPLGVSTVFSRWIHWGELKRIPDELKRYLERLPNDRSNVHMRRGRARRIDDLVDALLNRTACIQQLPAGWSVDPECRLDDAEVCWLDPGRTQVDEDFAHRCRGNDWPLDIGHRFGNWLSARIRSDRLRIDDEEHGIWKHQLREAIDAMVKELDDAR